MKKKTSRIHVRCEEELTQRLRSHMSEMKHEHISTLIRFALIQWCEIKENEQKRILVQNFLGFGNASSKSEVLDQPILKEEKNEK